MSLTIRAGAGCRMGCQGAHCSRIRGMSSAFSPAFARQPRAPALMAAFLAESSHSSVTNPRTCALRFISKPPRPGRDTDYSRPPVTAGALRRPSIRVYWRGPNQPAIASCSCRFRHDSDLDFIHFARSPDSQVRSGTARVSITEFVNWLPFGPRRTSFETALKRLPAAQMYAGAKSWKLRWSMNRARFLVGV